MKRVVTLWAVLCCCGMVCASPYGKALQKARQVAGQAEKRHAQAAAPAPRQEKAEEGEFKHLYVQIGEVARVSKGVLPGPAGAAGLKKLCGPGRVPPTLLKISDVKNLTEKNCPWTYVGGAAGVLKRLPKGGNFPLLFTKPAPGVREIKVLFADGTEKKLNGAQFKNSVSVVEFLRKSSPNAKHSLWNKLSKAAGQIDRASR